MFSRIIHIASILAVCSTTLAAQERTYAIQGTVSDDNGALLGAVVTYLHDGQEGTEYDITDSQGRFILRLNTSPSAKDSIRISMLGYATLTMPAEISGKISTLSTLSEDNCVFVSNSLMDSISSPNRLIL